MRKTKLEIAVCVALCGALFSYASMAGESTADVRSNVHVSIRKVSDQWDEAVQTLSGETQNGSWAGYSLGLHLVEQYLAKTGKTIPEAYADNYSNFKN